MDYSRATIGKNPRLAASASATSRKNKLQRCSVCGGLGHKSRTCDTAKSLMQQDLSDDGLSPPVSPENISRDTSFSEEHDSISDTRAAYVLLDMSKAPKVEIDLCPPPSMPPAPALVVAAPPAPAPIAPLAPLAPQPQPLHVPGILPPPPQLSLHSIYGTMHHLLQREMLPNPFHNPFSQLLMA